MTKSTKPLPAAAVNRPAPIVLGVPRLGLAAAVALATASFPMMTREAPAAAPPGWDRGMPPPNRGARAATFNAGSYDADAHTVEAVFSSGSPVRRWFGTEQLAISPEAIDLNRVAANLCPFLNAHNQYDIGAVLGRVVDARIENGQLVGLIQFNQTEAGIAAEGMVARGELTGISIGYLVRTWQLTEIDEAAGDTWIAAAWELLEVSLVPVPADPNAGVRSADRSAQPGQPAANIGDNQEENDMLKRDLGGGNAADPAAQAAPAAPAPAAAAPAVTRSEPAAPAAPAAVVVADAVNIAAIRAAVTNAGLADQVAFELIERHETSPLTRDALMADIGRRFAERDAAAATRSRAPATVSDGVTQLRAMEEAIVYRMSPGQAVPEVGREFRGMTLLRIAEEVIASSGVNVRGMPGVEIAERALMSTSDFPALMASVLNRRLRQAYEENNPSYRRWARRAPNAPNFKTIEVVQMSAMPDLLKVNEAGEIRTGTASDGKVDYNLLTYGRIIGVTRQVIVNDDLRALERITSGFAGAAARLENRTVYGILTANGNMPDGVALFHATHGNLAGSNAAIAAASLGSARAGMRLQKGLQSEELNLAPAYLIVPATQEQLAYQYTSSQFVPAKSTDVNEFRAGGRTALEPIVEAVLDGNSTTAWYLAADTAQVDTVEYAYLEGAEGVQLSSRVGFTVDGVEFKATLDFAAAAIDHRGLYKNIGA